MSRNLIYRTISLFFVTFLVLTACKKDYSYEGGLITFLAKGSLKDTLGNCQGITVSGAYKVDTALTARNYITVNANITAAGKYLIYTDTVNGCYFLDSGTVQNAGPQSFKLLGHGKPISPVFGSFDVHFDSTICTFTIPTDSSVYTFNSPVGSCPLIKVNGTYLVGANLNTADTVSVPVTVSVPGAYSIQTSTINGMSFSAKGVFTNTGNYNIGLKGSGAPFLADTTTIPIVLAGTNCGFAIISTIDTSMNWQFTLLGINYSGYLDSIGKVVPFTVPAYPANKLYAFQLNGGLLTGNLNTSTGLIIELSRINSPLSMGTYHPNAWGKQDFSCIFAFDIGHSFPNYSYFSVDTLPLFTTNLTTYDTNTNLVKGTFSGPMVDSVGHTVNITNGQFKAYFKH